MLMYISRSRTDLRGIPRGGGQAPHLPIVGGSLLPDVVHNRSGQPGMMLFGACVLKTKYAFK